MGRMLMRLSPLLPAGARQLRSARLTLLPSLPIYVSMVSLSSDYHFYTSLKMAPSDQTQDQGKYTLPSDFLSDPAPDLVVQRIDFSKTSLPEYDGLYATIIDNALSEAECNALIRAAEAHTNGKWSQAMVNVGFGQEKIITDARDCGRIIWDDHDVVSKIWARISSSVPEVEFIETAARITGHGPFKRGEKYQMTRLNERMRFLKYGAGQYFRRKQNPPPQVRFQPSQSPLHQVQEAKHPPSTNPPTNPPPFFIFSLFFILFSSLLLLIPPQQPTKTECTSPPPASNAPSTPSTSTSTNPTHTPPKALSKAAPPHSIPWTCTVNLTSFRKLVVCYCSSIAVCYIRATTY